MRGKTREINIIYHLLQWRKNFMNLPVAILAAWSKAGSDRNGNMFSGDSVIIFAYIGGPVALLYIIIS